MSNSKITTYSLLAYINQSEELKDYNDIFIPLIKQSIFSLVIKGLSKGFLLEIKSEFDTKYSLDIPFPLLKKLCIKIAKQLNSEGNNFTIHNDNSFEINSEYLTNSNELIKYSKEFDQHSEDIMSLNNFFNEYIEIFDLKSSEIPSLFDFIEQHRVALSSYFAHKSTPKIGPQFLVHAQFLKAIKTNETIYTIAQRIYLGSILSSYLELDPDIEVIDALKNTEFVLDTTVILSLLNLSSEELFITTSRIIEICLKLKAKLSVVDYTIEETSALLFRTSQSLDKQLLLRVVQNHSIYSACERRNLSKTDIERYADNLKRILVEEFSINIIGNTDKYKNIAKFNSDLVEYKARKANQDGAHHDLTVIEYVRAKRNSKNARQFYDSKCWFVTNDRTTANVCQEIYSSKFDDGFSEVILADDLINILWLSSPNIKTSEIKTIGLSRLIALTLQSNLPNPKMLKALDLKIQEYSPGNFSGSDIYMLSQRIADRTLKNIEEIVRLPRSQSHLFVDKLRQELEKARSEEERKEDKTKLFITKILEEQKQLIDKNRKIEIDLQNKHDEYVMQVSKELTDEILEIQKQLTIKRIEFEALRSENNILVQKSENIKMNLSVNQHIRMNEILAIKSIIFFLIAMPLIWYVFLRTNIVLSIHQLLLVPNDISVGDLKLYFLTGSISLLSLVLWFNIKEYSKFILNKKKYQETLRIRFKSFPFDNN